MAKRQRAGATGSSAGPVRRLVDWVVLSHLRAIDEEHIRPDATSDGRILFVIYSSCLLLFLLNYIVLTRWYQVWMAGFLIETLGLFGPLEAAQPSKDQMAVAMRISWSLGCMFFYLLIPGLLYRFCLKRRLVTLGLSPRGFLRHLWIYALLFLPVAVCVWAVSYQAAFQRTYPFLHNPSTMGHLLLWELFYGVQFLALEVFFRGYMLTELKNRWGWRAVLFMMTPYCMIHFSKPMLEALGAVVAGSVLGILALRTRNIWGGVAIHVAVAWSMDIASLLQRGWFAKHL